MSQKTHKAKHPHNTQRPSPAAVKKALAKGDMDALRLALTPRQRAFAEEYIIDFNATAAAVRAGYADNKSTNKQAYLLLHHEGVSAYIDHLRRSREQKINVANPDYVVQKITKILAKDEIRDSDAFRGLELLAKILGMLKDRTEISGPDGEAIRVQQQKQEEDIASVETLIKHLTEKRTFVITDQQKDI